MMPRAFEIGGERSLEEWLFEPSSVWKALRKTPRVSWAVLILENSASSH